METIVNIGQIMVDEMEELISNINDCQQFEIKIFDQTDEEQRVGIFIENKPFFIPNPLEADCRLMFDISKQEALFLGKSLIALAENLNEVNK